MVKSTSTNSVGSFRLARAWLQECIKTHGECRVDTSNLELPSRLLHLEPSDIQRIRVLDSSSLAEMPIYMTLSHCWGTAKFITLTEATYERLYNGIDVSELPQTFQDAVQVARKLGAKYLVCALDSV